jgi:multidrug efflux system membrane fusion protein
MRRRFVFVIIVVLAAAATGSRWYFVRGVASSAPNPAQIDASPAIPVTIGAAERKDVPVYVTGLGTVQAFNTVTVHVRVDGQLDKVAFTEGQDVKAGDLLAQIDPRPFQASLELAKAAKARDEAQLENAKQDLQRFEKVGTLAQSQQSIDAQKALIRQLEATILGDQASIDSAQTQLDYTTIKAPLSGRTGMRLVDQGNIVHATDTTGLVVITQLQPISVLFTLPEGQLSDIVQAMASGPLEAVAMERNGQEQIAKGTLALLDNQIDPTTGTTRLKATFPNDNHALWPGQFDNIRLQLGTLKQVVTVPSTAVQRGQDNLYVFAIQPDSTVTMQPVKVGQMSSGVAVIEEGLEPGAKIVVAGQYRLQSGSRVRSATDNNDTAPVEM